LTDPASAVRSKKERTYNRARVGLRAFNQIGNRGWVEYCIVVNSEHVLDTFVKSARQAAVCASRVPKRGVSLDEVNFWKGCSDGFWRSVRGTSIDHDDSYIDTDSGGCRRCEAPQASQGGLPAVMHRDHYRESDFSE
jgi:hypothetical protein